MAGVLGPARCGQLVHDGPYEELPLTYHVLARWLAERGHRLDAPIREAYLNDPATTPTATLATQVLVEIEEHT